MNEDGFSVVEVMVSMFLVALIAVFVATFFAFHNNMVSEAKKLTDIVYETQDAMEENIQTLISDIKSNHTGSYTTKQYSLFGKTVDMKLISAELLNPDNTVALKLDTGISTSYSTNNPEPNRPQLTSVDVTVGSWNKAVYFPAGADTALASYVKDTATIAYWYKNIYQWYYSSERTHAIPLANYTSNGAISPKYPWDFDIISLQAKKNMPGEDIVYPVGETAPQVTDFSGRFIGCAVTPGSNEGFLGSTKFDEIYVSALPGLAQGAYKMLIDPSLMDITIPGGFTGNRVAVNNNIIYSEKPLASIGSSLTRTSGTSNVYVYLDGANTSNNNTSGQEYYSRYFSITDNNIQMSFSNLDNIKSNDNISLYAIARSSANTTTPIVKYNGTPILGIDNNIAGQTIYPAYSEGTPAWYLVNRLYPVPDLKKLILGGSRLDIAEFIVVLNPSANENTAIRNYLLTKYGIN